MLDEKNLRRDGFDEGRSVAVDLPGGAFFLPKPVYRLRPTFKDGRRLPESAVLRADDPEFERLKEAVAEATKAEDGDFYGAAVDLAAYMLQQNYRIDDEQLGLVFGEPLDNRPAESWIGQVMGVAHGKGPKTSAVG